MLQGRYRLLEVVDQGGMGQILETFRAHGGEVDKIIAQSKILGLLQGKQL